MTAQKTSTNRSLAHIQAKIRNPKSRYSFIHSFRRNSPESSYVSYYKKLFPFKASLNDFHGPAFPKSCAGMFSSRAPKQHVGALKEMLWAMARSLQFAVELKAFQTQRRFFEEAILREEYILAMEIIAAIERDYGKSIWFYQNKLAAAYIAKNDDEPGLIAAEIANEVNGREVLDFLFYYITRRCEGAALREKLKDELTEKVKIPLYLEYFQAKVFDFTNSAEEAVSSLLFIDSQASLIDHYESLVHSLQAAVSDEMIPEELTGVISSTLVQLYKEINDPRLMGIIGMFGITSDNRLSEHAIARSKAIEAYTRNDYSECKNLCDEILLQHPTDSALRIIRLKSLLETGDPLVSSKGLIGELEEHFINLLAATEKFYSSAHAVFVLADRFCDHAWMLYLRVYLMYEIGPEENARIQRWTRDIYTRDQFSTPMKILCCPKQSMASSLAKIESQGLYPATLKLVKSITDIDCVKEISRDARFARYQARETMVQGNYKLASELYKDAAKREKRPSLRLRAYAGASLSLILGGDFRSAIEIAIDAYLECPHAPSILPIEKLVAALPDMELWPNTPKLGLLLNLSQQFSEGNDLSDQRLSFEKFCQDNDIKSPSDLWEKSEYFGVPCVINYLSFVWQPETMRQTLIYTAEDQIEEARIQACKILVKVDTDKARTHQEELASRIKQQEISKTTALVEQSKVYVDIETIKRSLRVRLNNSYARYKGSLVQHGKPQDQLLKKFESILSELEGEASLPVLLSTLHLVGGGKSSTVDLQFDAIFTEIAKEFLSGDHGLNAYLSTRVRHGKLVDALRKPVMDENLVTSKTTTDAYAPNLYWKSRLPFEHQDKILQALETFAHNYDDSLIFVRDKVLQIQTFIDMQKSRDDNAQGLFKYQFSQLERRHVQSYDTEFDDIDELIIKCVDTLWEKTDANLFEVRNYLTTQLRADLMREFDQLELKINDTLGSGKVGSLSNSIAKARTATQQALDNVVGWFHRSEVYDRKDFEIDLPAQIAAIMVNRAMSMPVAWPGPKLLIEHSDANLPGRSLDTLVDIFYVLFENAVKYAESRAIGVDVDLRLQYQNGEFFGTMKSSALPPTAENLERLTQIRESLATPESRRLAQSEGRSGFRKIHNALDSPLYKSQKLNFEHQIDGVFKVEFSFKISEIQ